MIWQFNNSFNKFTWIGPTLLTVKCSKRGRYWTFWIPLACHGFNFCGSNTFRLLNIQYFYIKYSDKLTPAYQLENKTLYVFLTITIFLIMWHFVWIMSDLRNQIIFACQLVFSRNQVILNKKNIKYTGNIFSFLLNSLFFYELIY